MGRLLCSLCKLRSERISCARTISSVCCFESSTKIRSRKVRRSFTVNDATFLYPNEPRRKSVVCPEPGITYMRHVDSTNSFEQLRMDRTPRIIPLTLTSTKGTTAPQPGLFAVSPATLQLQTRSTLQVQDYECAFDSLDLTYSWPNVATVYQNTTMSYNFNGTVYSFNILPGFYSIDDLNNQLNASMIANGLYLVSTINGVSTNATFLSFEFSPNYLTCQIQANQIPVNLSSSLTNPNNIGLSGFTPSLIVNAGFSGILGFQPGTYPGLGNVNSTIINGQNPSVLNPVKYVSVQTNLVNSTSYNSSGSDIYTFVPQGSYGSSLSVRAFERVWYPVTANTLQNVTVTLVDQNGTPLPLLAGLPITVKLYLRRVY